MSLKVAPMHRRRGAEADREQLAHLMERLVGLFPELSRAELERVVQGRYDPPD